MNRFWSLLLLSASSGLLFTGCGSKKSDGGEDVIMTKFVCDDFYGTSCGASCGREVACAGGLFCLNGSCTAECAADSDCEAGVCSGAGRCVASLPSDGASTPVATPSDATGGQGNQPSEVCAQQLPDVAPTVPQVWMLLDRSGSMKWSMLGEEDDSLERWLTLGSVLFGSDDDPSSQGVVGRLEASVSLGATFFTSDDDCALVTDSVPIGLNNYNALSQKYGSLEPGRGTPTALAYSALVDEALAVAESEGPKIIIMATDGEPGCSENETPEQDVESAVAAAHEKGILTFAVSIGQGGQSLSHLQRVANLGQGLPSDGTELAPYYTGEDAEALQNAFEEVIEGARTCIFELGGEVNASLASQGRVKLDGSPLLFEGQDGWRLQETGAVELVGKPCEVAKSRPPDELGLQIEFPCDSFTPSPP